MGHTEIWSRLFSLTSPRPGGLGGWDGLPPPLPRNQRPQIMAAIGGIDIALWDIKGKAVGLPVFRLLGGTRTEVFTYSTGGYYVCLLYTSSIAQCAAIELDRAAVDTLRRADRQVAGAADFQSLIAAADCDRCCRGGRALNLQIGGHSAQHLVAAK